MMLTEHQVRLSQAGEPYEEEKSVPPWRGLLPVILIVWTLLCGAGYCLLQAWKVLH